MVATTDKPERVPMPPEAEAILWRFFDRLRAHREARLAESREAERTAEEADK